MYEIARTRAALSGRYARPGMTTTRTSSCMRRGRVRAPCAKPDLAAVETELQELEERRVSRSQVRMAFLFTDIVGSTRLAEALGDHAGAPPPLA